MEQTPMDRARAERERYPLLTAFGERGPFTFTGAPLSSLVIEVRGTHLSIIGVTPLRDDGERYIQSGAEYEYRLEGMAGEKLLSALRADFGGRPALVIAWEFEFSKPHCPLTEYLDCLQLVYEYYYTEGNLL